MRTFIAIELTPDLQAALRAAREQLARQLPAGTVRWVRPEGMHLTLKFLGDVTTEQAEALRSMLAAAARSVQPFTLRVSDMGCFPDTRQPRVIWLGIAGDRSPLLALQRAIEAGAVALGHAPEKRGFSPHLTLGRIDRHARTGDVRHIGEVVQHARTAEVGEWPVNSVNLVKSDLRPAGAVYTSLGQFALGETSDGAD